MKYKYKKKLKANLNGKQIKPGDIVKDIGGLPLDWFEAIEEKTQEAKPKKKKEKKEEVVDYGYSKGVNTDLDG